MIHTQEIEAITGFREHPETIEPFVRSNPNESYRLYTIFHEKELGKSFVNVYGANPEWHQAAYFISQDLGVPIQRNEWTDPLPSRGNSQESTLRALNKLSENIISRMPAIKYDENWSARRE